MTVFARVRDGDNVDLAIAFSRTGRAVVRCVGTATPADHHALATMITERDFTRAFIVHAGDETGLTGDIPTYPLSRIDELAALLAKESPP